MKKFKKLLIVLPVIAAMVLASIPVAASYSQVCYGGDNVGMYGNYEWSISIYSGYGYAEGNYFSGTGLVNAYLNTYFHGTVSNTQSYRAEISSSDSVTSGGVYFYL